MTISTDAEVKGLKPKEKIYYEHLGNGLYVHVRPNGHKTFQYRFKLDGKAQQVGLGTYPETSLAMARRAHEAARAKVKVGQHPTFEPKTSAEEMQHYNFRRIALSWLALRASRLDKKYSNVIRRSIERELFPRLGDKDIREIKKTEVLTILKYMEYDNRLETAKKTKQRISSIFKYASGVLDISVADPTLGSEQYIKSPKPTRLPAIVDLEGVRQILSDVASARAYPLTKLGLYFAALTAMRSGEIRYAEWSELDLDALVWNIPGHRMKMKLPHSVPITPQLLAVINAVRTLTGECKYIFPNATNLEKPMSENTMNKLLHNVGYKGRHVVHGFRSSFSTIMNEAQPDNYNVIEKMLAHEIGSDVSRAYNRGSYSKHARQIAEEYANLLLNGLPEPAALLSGPAH